MTVLRCMRTTEQKRAELLRLAKKRQGDRRPPHLSLAEVCGGLNECCFVSPWTKSACNVDCELMLVGQDWASSDTLEQESEEKRRLRKRLGQDWSSRTNSNIREFLEDFGISFSDTYATNLFPFIKKGQKNSPIAFHHLVYCAETYAIPQIEIVSPRIAICLGKKTFDAVRCAAGKLPLDWKAAYSPSAHTRIGSVEIYGLPHPSPQGILNAGGKDTVKKMWNRLAEHLHQLRKHA